MNIYIFTRDLRLYDNSTFVHNMHSSHTNKVLPIFIFPPEQIDANKNKYFSNSAVQFMCESLQDLDKQLRSHGSKLHVFKGDHIDILSKIHRAQPITKVFFNQDYSVYAKKRDAEIAAWCKTKNIEVVSLEDYSLVSIRDGLIPDGPNKGKPYGNLSQYYARFFKDLKVRKPQRMTNSMGASLVKHNFSFEFPIEKLSTLYEHNPNLAQRGGRTEGLKMLAQLKAQTKYGTRRDFPADEHGTSKASAHLRFGTISVREMYWRLRDLFGPRHPLIRELVFRDFYLKIYAHRPELQRGVAYRADLDKKIPWNMDRTRWTAWTTGHTGYPIVDAGMRQLFATGWMHNRVRMTQASVATRYFLLDWRKCAQFFYRHLVDADPYSNTAGWQWAAGIGVDSAPYFRAPFNPFRQSKRFDPNAEYIYRWVPELRNVATKDIHKWDDPKVRAKYPDISYPAPIPRLDNHPKHT